MRVHRPLRPPEDADPNFSRYEPNAPTIEMPILSDGILADPQQVSRPASPGWATQRPQPGTEPVATPSVKRSSNLVAAGIMLSRLSGLVREMVVTGYLGVSIAADAFKATLMIPKHLHSRFGWLLNRSCVPDPRRFCRGWLARPQQRSPSR